MSGRLGDLGLRFASALAMVFAALWTLHLGGLAFQLFWLAAGLAVFWEWQRMIGGGSLALRLAIGAVALCLASFAPPDAAIMALAVGAGALALACDAGRRLWTAAGLAYAGALVVSLGLLRQSPTPYAQLSILWIFALVWGTDVMAYFGGRLIGGPKLWQAISPSKTWSGTLTGVVCGAALGFCATLWSASPVSPWRVALLGLGIACLSQAGDLMESAMKRHFGVKDSSRLIPGHGGFMDRLDGFIAAATFAAAFGTLRFGDLQAAAGLFHD